jgi:hypothetical protein
MMFRVVFWDILPCKMIDDQPVTYIALIYGTEVGVISRVLVLR